MTLSSADLRTLTDCACDAARAAGEFIARSRPAHVEHKEDGGTTAASQIVTEVDRQSQELIIRAIAPTASRFDLAILAEEDEDDRQRLERDYFWCIDPLDGTLPFVEGNAGYAVSIALVRRDGRPCIGVVFDPVRQALYRACTGHGATIDGRPWALATPSAGRPLSLFVDRSFEQLPGHPRVLAGLRSLADDLGARELTIADPRGAVMNACGVLEHGPACYFKFPKPSAGGGSLWDFAATACLFAELGAPVCDIHGAPLDLNRPDSTFMNHRGVVYASSPLIAQRVRDLYLACHPRPTR